MPKNLIVFDMDGVLVDVTASYRAAIQQTVSHFSGVTITNEQIQEYKNRGGWNDDWLLSQQILKDNGLVVRYQDVVDFFQSVFLGDGTNGLIQRERWIADPGLLDRLGQNNTLGIFTGRMHWEADLTLNRFAPGMFTEVIGVDDVLHPKPSPEGLLKISNTTPHLNVWYVGDSVDDSRAAKEARIPFIGIASKHAPDSTRLAELLKADGAIAVLENINEMERHVQG
jgi:HAD superfamily phosphatase